MKHIISVFVVLATALSVTAIPAFAETNYSTRIESPSEWVLTWDNVSSIDLGISFSGSTATCSARIRGYSNVNKITATFTLKRVNSNGTMTTLKTWSESSSTNSLIFSDTYSPVSKDEIYRLEVTATVTANGIGETVSDSAVMTY
ncbi:MAG: hypothetical protein FWG70_09370 [Oscillospiraceae bacterium]|nr:hypothetical protein [Oscillospiraceae bacterium]